MNNKELRLLIEIIEPTYKQKYNKKPPFLWLQYEIYLLTGQTVPIEKIKSIKPFKNILKKTVISIENDIVTLTKLIRKRK